MESLNEEVKFTVFARYAKLGDGIYYTGDASGSPHGLAAIIAHIVGWPGEWIPYAWCEGTPNEWRDTHTVDSRKEESIAAGRVIEQQADGSFIPRGVGGEALFRVGGIYRDQSGELMRLEAFGHRMFNNRPYARAIPVGNDWREHAGGRFLDNGWYVHANNPNYAGNLIPGELNEQGEPIACGSPIAATPPTTEPKAADADMKLRDLRGDAPARAARWASKQKSTASDLAEVEAKREAEKSLGTARNPHPHWGADAGLVK